MTSANRLRIFPSNPETTNLTETNRTMPPGRPTKFNPETAGKIILAVKAGNYVETAAAFAGVCKDSVYAWLERGRKRNELGEIDTEDLPYAQFSDGLETARAQAEMDNVEIIQKAARTTWQAAAWFLERQYFKRWGLNSRTIIEGDLTVKISNDPLGESHASDND